MPKRPDEEHQLLRPFDEDVRMEKGRELAEHVHQMQQLEAAAKAAAAEAKEAINKHRTKALGLKDDLRSGKHLVPVQCRWVMDTHNWSLIASDGEVIRTQPTTMADRQGELLS